MAWLHTWTGLVAGWLLFFVFVTGAAGYFNFEIDRWMRPELPLAPSASSAQFLDDITLAQAHLQATQPGAELWNIGLPVERTQPQFSVFSREPRKADGTFSRPYRATLDTATGQFIQKEAVRDTGGGQLLYRMHYLLHYVPDNLGIWIVGACTMLMLIAIISGVITHKKIFVDFFTFRRGKGQRSWLDAHNLVSVAALPFFLMITYSGLVLFMSTYMSAGAHAVYGPGPQALNRLYAELYPIAYTKPSGRPVPLASLSEMARQAEAQWHGMRVSGILVRNPGDAAAVVTIRAAREGGSEISIPRLQFNGGTGRLINTSEAGAALQTYETLVALHEGRYAGPVLRWLYFLASLLGCVMIATGLVLWRVKRQARHSRQNKTAGGTAFGYRLIECLNVGTIAGLPFAVAAYFWANRLIPADMAHRAQWEAHAMFIAWGMMFLYPAFRRHLSAWTEELTLAALAYMLLPLVNMLTTDRHLAATIPAGDWAMAGFDLTMLGLGCAFAYIALKVARKDGRAIRPLPATLAKTLTQSQAKL